MLSVRSFKSDHPERSLLRSSIYTKEPDASVWKKCFQQLLLSSPTPSLQFEKCRQVLVRYLHSCSDHIEFQTIIDFMKESIEACFKQDNLALVQEEFSRLIIYVSQFSFLTLSKYSWAKDAHRANLLSVFIICSLCKMASEFGWIFFDKINRNALLINRNEIMTGVLNALFSQKMHLCDTYLTYINYLWSELDNAPLNTSNILVIITIEATSQQIEQNIIQFREKLVQKNVALIDDNVTYNLDRMLFSSFATRVRLTILQEQFDLAKVFLNQCELLKKKYNSDKHLSNHFVMLQKMLESRELSAKKRMASELNLNAVQKNTEHHDELKIHSQVNTKTSIKTDVLLRKEDVASEPRPLESGNPLANARGSDTSNETMPKTNETTPILNESKSEAPITSSVTIKEQPKLTHKEREKERKRLKKIESTKKRAATRHEEIQALVSETTRKPRCYTHNAMLCELLHDISAVFNRSLCEGYLFGSAIYKESPNDFDIVLPHIQSTRDEANVAELINLFEEQGGVVDSKYKKSNRHVISIVWKGWKIDFILFEHSYPEHAKILDFTVGAMYFDLRQLTLFRINCLHSLLDWDKKRINTITDAYTSFTSDPSRIFRAIRLIATEEFYFSQECLDAIKVMFAGERNVFTTMNPGKLNQQLSLLCSSGRKPQKNERKNIEVLHYQLGLFYKLYDALSERQDPNAKEFIKHFRTYHDEFSIQQHQNNVLLSYNLGFFNSNSVEQQPLNTSRPSLHAPVSFA